MRVLSIGYILREAWRGLTRARISSFAAIGIIAFMLVLLGIVGYIFNLVNCTFAGVSNQLEIIVYLNDNLKAEERKSLKDNITSIEGVKEVVYIPKNEAWKRFKETFKGNKLVLEIIGENPLPDSFEIKLIDRNYMNY
ncbi:MAG TPA: permease-like cell division protein FtsX, partial [bacterium]|nr:permease-like cell division protein FtsX [bacterium]